MPLTEIQRHNIEQFLEDPTNWTDKAAKQICADIKQRLVELEQAQPPQALNVFVQDMLLDMRDEGRAMVEWANKLEEAMRNGQ